MPVAQDLESTAQSLATPTRAEAVRFLQRTTFGPRPGEVDHVRRLGIHAWLDEQIATPARGSHLQRRIDFGSSIRSLWETYLSSDDQLRKRFAYALSQIFVTSARVVGNERIGAYADLLEAHCFGTYRELLEHITRSQAMGQYLTYEYNQRADPARGTVPDENYAREILQLFSIGLTMLNPDGTEKRRSGRPIPTYDNDDIVGLARVFTGFSMPFGDLSIAARPMNSDDGFARDWHERGEKRFLGEVIGPGRDLNQSVAQALDIIANHPNVGPFIGKQLIQRLVTSNPSPAYVARVSGVFADNGNGRRGDLAAVLRAIVTDPEAWRASPPAQVGKIREPVLRFTAVTRALGVSCTAPPWPIFSLADRADALGQQPFDAPSVFNFYRPGYSPPNTAIAARGHLAPEFQIVDETTAFGWLNFLQGFLMNPPRDGSRQIRFDIDDLIALAPNDTVRWQEAKNLVDEIIGRLCPFGVASSQRSRIIRAVRGAADPALAPGDSYNRNRLLRERVMGAVVLVAATPDFIHER
jgi:uncharacterized protein (DUF1800 family)